MIFKIHFTKNLVEDYFTLVGENIDDIRDSVKRELLRREIDESECWSESIEDGK